MTGFLWLRKDEERNNEFASKRSAQSAARIESQRTGMAHTHYLTTTYRNLEERLCWTIIPVTTARKMLGAL